MKFMQIKPQKCRGKFTESLWTDPAYSAENKEDGDRRISQFMGAHAIRFTGTRESVGGGGFVEKSANIPHLSGAGWGRDHDKLIGTVLDGEIVAPWAEKLPGGSSKHVTAIMGSSPERAVQLQRQRGWLHYVVFDCLWFKGRDIRECPLNERKVWLGQALHMWKNPYVEICSSYTKESEKRSAWAMAREGLVFKHQDHIYGNERLWVKLKKEATADVVVMDFKAGKGKYAGSVGAIKFGQWAMAKEYCTGPAKMTLIEFGTCRGFTDAMMTDMSIHAAKYRGRVFRITHNGREPTGKFRHPRFDGWRDDKNQKDCIYDPEET